jgi:hypothetical protein
MAIDPNFCQGVFLLALLERIVSTPDNVFVADTRENAVHAAIVGAGVRPIIVPRTVIWPTLLQFANDNSNFTAVNPSPQAPDFVWASGTGDGQTLGFAVSSYTYTFSQTSSLDIHVIAFGDNALQMQIDLVNADTNAIISTPPLGTLLNDGSMAPAAGVTIETTFFTYNWQNVRFYSISTGLLPPGHYRIVTSFTVVNYKQFPNLPNPAAIAFAIDIHELIPIS